MPDEFALGDDHSATEHTADPAAASTAAPEINPDSADNLGGHENKFLQRAAQARAAAPADDSNADDLPANDEADKAADEDPNKPPAEETTEPPPAEKPDRASLFKQHQNLQAEHSELQTRVAQTEAQLEKFGGVEGFQHMANIYDGFIDPNGTFTVPDGVDAEGKPQTREVTGRELVLGFVEDLPEGGALFSDFFIRGLENPANRMFAINDVLQSEFNLRKDVNVSQEQINKVFDLLSAKLNMSKSPADIEKVFSDFEFELKGLDYNATEDAKDRELREAREELARLKAPKQPEAAETKTVDPMQDFQTKMVQLQTDVDAFEDTNFNEQAPEFLTKYGLAPADTDTPEIKKAKETLCNILTGRDNLTVRMRGSQPHKQVVNFMLSGKKDGRNFQISSNNYKSAMRANIAQILEDISLVTGGVKAAPNKPKSPAPPPANRAAIHGNEPAKTVRTSFMDKAESVTGRKFS